jgi:hypothetical protein
MATSAEAVRIPRFIAVSPPAPVLGAVGVLAVPVVLVVPVVVLVVLVVLVVAGMVTVLEPVVVVEAVWANAVPPVANKPRTVTAPRAF